jgi:hypothetical protein
MKGYLVHFIWDWTGEYYGLTQAFNDRVSCYWVPVNAYAESQLANIVAWLTSGNTWVKVDEGDWPDVNKRRIQIYQYFVQRVEL